MSDHCAFCNAKEEYILGTWCGACWKPVCSVKCAAHARIHGLSVVRNVAELNKIMHGCMQSGCMGRAGWKCDGCNKRLCPEHQIIQNHDCTVCHYCGNSANGMCNGCDRYSCSMSGCWHHRQVCSKLQTALETKSKCKSSAVPNFKFCKWCDER